MLVVVMAFSFDAFIKYKHFPVRLSLLPSVINSFCFNTLAGCLAAFAVPTLGLLADGNKKLYIQGQAKI